MKAEKRCADAVVAISVYAELRFVITNHQEPTQPAKRSCGPARNALLTLLVSAANAAHHVHARQPVCRGSVESLLTPCRTDDARAHEPTTAAQKVADQLAHGQRPTGQRDSDSKKGFTAVPEPNWAATNPLGF